MCPFAGDHDRCHVSRRSLARPGDCRTFRRAGKGGGNNQRGAQRNACRWDCRGGRPACARRGADRGDAWPFPFHPPKAVEACRDKHKMRQTLSPGRSWQRSARLSGDAGCRSACGRRRRALSVRVEAAGAIGASRGVIRANNPAEFIAAFERIRPYSRATGNSAISRRAGTEQIQIEDYIEGREDSHSKD